jgi:hypothetical protein
VSARAIAGSVLALAFASQAAAQEAPQCAPADLAALSGWQGIWIAENIEADINGREAPNGPPLPLGMKLLGLQAPWNEAGWTRLETAWGPGADGSFIQTGWSFPVMMSSPAPFKFVISPSETVIASQYRDIRYIYTDGRGHTPEDELWATPWGDSTGCWEGDTLTVETIGIRYAPAYNPFSPPLSENARVTERYRLTSPDRLVADFTITDPELLERPWEVHMVYLRHPVLTRLVHDGDVLENDRIETADGQLTITEVSAEPTRISPAREVATLTTAELDRVVGRYTLVGPPIPIELVLTRRGNRVFSRAEPIFPIDMPILPSDPLNFFSRISPETYSFTTDTEGHITGFTGTTPQGDPMRATRRPD